MHLMRKLFGRIMEEETGGESSSGGGGVESDPQPLSSSSPAPAADSGSGSSNEPAGGDAEPKSMLEAISQSLEKPGKKEEAPGAGDPQAKPEDKKAEKPAAGAEEPMPEGLSPKAQERFRELSGKVKEYATQNQELTSRIEQMQQQAQPVLESVRQFFDSTGATPEQMNTVAAYLQVVNSGDLQTEANMLVNRLRDIQIEMGKPLDVEAGLDPLQQFPDLAAAVAGYQITREHALEIARGRSYQQQAQQVEQQEAQRTGAQQQWASGKDKAIGVLREWERSTAASDPDYAAIAPTVIGNKQALSWIIENVPPSGWHQHLTMLYNQAKAVRATVPRTTGGDPRPLSGAGAKPRNSEKAPNSMFEAMFPGG